MSKTSYKSIKLERVSFIKENIGNLWNMQYACIKQKTEHKTNNVC